MKSAALVLLILCLAACGQAVPAADTAADRIVEDFPEPADPIARRAALPDYLDCIREAGGVLIAAHRAGPAPGYPENAIETMAYGLSRGVHVFEIDVVESRDGVQFLLHDRTLGRTTTGNGSVADTDWVDIATLRLVDNAGTVTSFAPPRFTDALLWAKDNDAILEVDRKDTTSFRNIISNVRAADAEDHVILISYTNEQAAEIAALAPDLMMTATARGGRDIAALENAGVDSDNLIAWTGTREPDAPAWARNARQGVESAFGTLGRPGERLDDAYGADGDLNEYQSLVDDGLVLLATDAPYAVADYLTADDRANRACGR
ncbi:MAG: glycerophosphodiester phosphodiesterase family protein [Pseudomonadota bacterium]